DPGPRSSPRSSRCRPGGGLAGPCRPTGCPGRCGSSHLPSFPPTKGHSGTRSLLLVFPPCPLERRLDVAPDVGERHAAARVDRHVALARPVVVVEQRAVAHTAARPLRMVGDPDLDRIVALAELDVGRADAEPPVAGVVGADAAPREPKRLLPRGGTDES